ncbi:HpcH/HpaI aldolase family protein [Roseomonas xinghualingensis]|uniref:HpcH/HpaI aldolase family protein n=1 Tax=Roseomonas xinghualingensis TaxID=2986475 RepID=UPI0021F1E893|nr:aldolase/citrate lyase family protein [Roseomonas sp. SXEYE001]MCV4207934.1 aldolase/citrate lyase family protein [Roseomonas sp. SXEYE001]
MGVANKLKDAWKGGKKTVNGWLAIPTAFSSELMAQLGFDSLTVDLQHGVQDYMSAVACFQGMQPHGTTPLARVPWNEPGIIGKLLDAGAQGLICPMVNTKEQAEAFVAACRYPPLGNRSNGPVRAGIYGEPGRYFYTANDDVLCIPMIETKEALDNLDAILDVPGVDGIYVGPTDLGISLGILPPVMDREEPEILRIYEMLVKKCDERGKWIGIHCTTGAYVKRMHDMGFTFGTMGSDVTNLVLGVRAQLAGLKG